LGAPHQTQTVPHSVRPIAVKFIKPRIGHDEAVKRLERRRFCLVPRRSTTFASSRLPYLELVWLPYYVTTIEVNSKAGTGHVTASVEGYSGAFALFDINKLDFEDTADRECFTPLMTAENAAEIARTRLVRTAFQVRRGIKNLRLGSGCAVEIVQYPYWVYYYERRRGRLDIRVLDAVTGSKSGQQIRISLLTAFTSSQQHRSRADKSRPPESQE